MRFGTRGLRCRQEPLGVQTPSVAGGPRPLAWRDTLRAQKVKLVSSAGSRGGPTRPWGAGRVAAPWRWSLRRARHVLPEEVAPNQGQALLGGREVSQAPLPVSLPGHHYGCADFGRRSGGAGAWGLRRLGFRLPTVAQVIVSGGGPSPAAAPCWAWALPPSASAPPPPHLLSKQNMKIQRRKLKCRNLGRIWAPVPLRVGDGDGAERPSGPEPRAVCWGERG